MLKRFLKAAALRATESIGAVVLVLGFFLASLAILSLSFPRGTSLQDLVSGTGWSPSEPLPANPEIDVGTTPDAGPRYVARLTNVYRKVKDKRADWIAWGDSRSGMPLEARHAIQTYARSGATITFDDQSQATLGENSLLVIRGQDAPERKDADPAPSERTVSLLITDGEIRATHAPGEGAMEILTSAGSGRILAQSPATDMKVSVNPDHTATFSVYGGRAEVTEAGRTVQVNANQTVTVEPGRPPGDPQALPGVPVPLSPMSGTMIAYRTVPPRVRMSWGPAERAEAYRVELARDKGFHDLVDLEDRVMAQEFTHGNLSAGAYYWRVRALSGWADGPPSPGQRMQLAEDNEPPTLDVDFPAGTLAEQRIVLRGTAERGAEVFVRNERVVTDAAGRFEIPLALRRGFNVVVVEAHDPAGNATYRSGLLDAKF